MFGERRVSALVRRYAEDRGYPFISISQPQHLFRKELYRKFDRVAVKGDPFWAHITSEKYALFGESHYGVGDTPDAAVLAAIPHDLRASLARCETAVDSLRDCLQKLLREEN
jgi:hypothetical protein